MGVDPELTWLFFPKSSASAGSGHCWDSQLTAKDTSHSCISVLTLVSAGNGRISRRSLHLGLGGSLGGRVSEAPWGVQRHRKWELSKQRATAALKSDRSPLERTLSMLGSV